MLSSDTLDDHPLQLEALPGHPRSSSGGNETGPDYRIKSLGGWYAAA